MSDFSTQVLRAKYRRIFLDLPADERRELREEFGENPIDPDVPRALNAAYELECKLQEAENERLSRVRNIIFNGDAEISHIEDGLGERREPFGELKMDSSGTVYYSINLDDLRKHREEGVISDTPLPNPELDPEDEIAEPAEGEDEFGDTNEHLDDEVGTQPLLNSRQVFLVTIKQALNPSHDPENKFTGLCPVSWHCTDSTGEHHTTIAMSEEEVEQLREVYGHITRVEEAYIS